MGCNTYLLGSPSGNSLPDYGLGTHMIRHTLLPLLLAAAPANAGLDVPPTPPDLSAYATTQQLKTALATQGSTTSIGQVTITNVAPAQQIMPAAPGALIRKIRNSGTVSISVGPDATVTTATGYVVPPDGELDINWTGPVFGITSSGANMVSFMVVMP